MSGDLETRIEGDPAAIEAIGSWLRTTLRDAATAYADTVLKERSNAEAAWEGDTSEAFRARLTTLAGGVDVLTEQARARGSSVDTLAADLRTAQAETERARQTAREGGLTVDGTLVRYPGEGPPAPTPPSADAPAVLVDGYHRALADFDAHQQLLGYWKTVVTIVQDAITAWDAALEVVTERWLSGGGNLATLAHGFLAGAVGGVSLSTDRYAFEARETLHRSNLESIRSHIDAMTNPDGSTRAPSRWMNDMLDRLDAEARAAAAAKADLDNAIKPSANVARVLNGLGYVVTGYAIYDDWANGGESFAQAVTSNGGGLLVGAGTGSIIAGIASGAAMGATIGTTVPVAGTVVGAVVGAGVGIFASGAIDSIWENGWSSDAFGDGFSEVGGTITAVGGLANSGWKALFD